MSDFHDWKTDQEFIHSEFVNIIVGLDRVVLQRVLWLNPVGVTSSRVAMEVPLLSETKVTIEHRTLVVGWKCAKCKTTLFAVDMKGLRHEPCCSFTAP